MKALRDDTCRAELQNQMSLYHKTSDVPGQFFEMSTGISCGFYSHNEIRLEGGVDWREGHDHDVETPSDALQGHVQAQFFDIDERNWGLSAGIHSLGVHSGINDYNVAYVMAQHQGGTYRFGLGGYTGNTKLLVNDIGAADSQGIMVGAWKKVDGGDLALELQTGRNRIGYFFIGGRKIVAQRTFLSAGYGKANNSNLMRDWALVNLGFVF
ncbi:MAG: hypothetical protein SGJ18_00620 [Pseudomonadota bacterium]|nr:hypothetical protein [Pseudomonadota bacterium]